VLAEPLLARGDLGRPMPGPLLFARFAFPPNRLGLCGPETGGLLPGSVRDQRPDPELVEACRGFEGAWPYLELIARGSDIADPLDRRVVEAYWIGSELSDRPSPRARHADLATRFRARTSAPEWPWLEGKAAGSSPVHHSFHVLEVMPRIGLLRGGIPAELLETMEQCLVRPGRVVSVEGERVAVSAPRLVIRDGALHLDARDAGVLDLEEGGAYGDVLLPGDIVALHWGRICGRLSPDQSRRLAAATRRNLRAASETL
jgi:hypothetical protein